MCWSSHRQVTIFQGLRQQDGDLVLVRGHVEPPPEVREVLRVGNDLQCSTHNVNDIGLLLEAVSVPLSQTKV